MSNSAASRIVLLGASNLARGIGTVVATAGAMAGRPSRYFIACGHGRSFGEASHMCGRYLPGIMPCALWDDLARDNAHATPTRALITDIGNDLLYGSGPDTILDWIETCLRRLGDCGARVVVTKLPIANVQRVPQWKFLLLRNLLFFRSKATLDQVLRDMATINAGLDAFVTSHGIHLVDNDPAWYGFDPIHILRRHWRTAYAHIFGHWLDDGAPRPAVESTGLRRWMYLRSLLPYERRWLWREQKRAQPQGHLPDGSTIALY